MSSAKRTATKSERLSGFFKRAEARRLVESLLRANPDLTLRQTRRLLSHAYQALRPGKTGAERLYHAAKLEAAWKEKK